MKPQFSSSLCAVLVALLLLLPACQSTDPGHLQLGPSSMQKTNMEQICATYEKNPPATLQDMTKLLGAKPFATGADENGDYALWDYSESTDSVGFYRSQAGVLSKDGRIIASNIFVLDYNYGQGERESAILGDKTLFDGKIHPEMARLRQLATHHYWRENGKHKGYEVSISPSGKSFEYLLPGTAVARWEGEKAIIVSSDDPAVANQRSTAGAIFGTVGNLLKTTSEVLNVLAH